jgi:hypothetical protein
LDSLAREVRLAESLLLHVTGYDFPTAEEDVPALRIQTQATEQCSALEIALASAVAEMMQWTPLVVMHSAVALGAVARMLATNIAASVSPGSHEPNVLQWILTSEGIPSQLPLPDVSVEVDLAWRDVHSYFLLDVRAGSKSGESFAGLRSPGFDVPPEV